MTIIQERMRIRVHGLRLLRQRRVHLDHFAADRRVELRDRLDRLDRAEDVTLVQRPADVRQLEVDDVAELLSARSR